MARTLYETLARMVTHPRGYTRERRYTEVLTIGLTRQQLDDVLAEANRRNCALTVVIRECIDRALPLLRDADRKRRDRSAAPADAVVPSN